MRKYETLVNEFLSRKRVRIDDDGDILIYRGGDELRVMAPHRLSSGEKQLLILLTQALLREDVPVVYVVDEPELSLHVKWQEQLLSSLLDLGGQMQIIVATHSPDIVGRFLDRVIDLERSAR